MRVPEKVRHWLKIEWPGEVVHRVGMGGVQEKVPEIEKRLPELESLVKDLNALFRFH